MACASTSSRHSADPIPPSLAVPQLRTVVEYRKDGAISKMRSHKGNIPVLPQTKLCPHCPAKFTRTTHLNRHLRTHTGDRSHHCDTCDAQFTRSDLLTRHKKTCGDSSHANRTRRRSCQACADSKVKCDLQRPCSKCQARGKECVFVIRSSRPSGMGVVPTLTTTTVERSSDSEDRAPVLIPTPPRPATSPSPKLYYPADHLPVDQQTQGDCHWVTTPSSANTNAAPSPSEQFCTGSASDTSSPASVPSQSPFSTLFSGDLLDPFLAYPGYNNTSVSTDHSHSPSDPVVPSPISVVDDPTPFTTQGINVQHAFHTSGGSVYYAPSSAHQVQHVIPKEHAHLQRQRYVQDHFMPHFSGQIPNFKQQNLTEEQHDYAFDSSPAHGRSRVRAAGPYQLNGNARRALRQGQFGSQLHLTFVDALDGDYYGRNCEKSTSQPRVSGGVHSTQHWPVVPQESDVFDALPRFGSDDQKYRATFAECSVDALQWNGALITRRQVIDPA